ncbi:hypothetical protein GQ464_014305 [Rhodocaloribacter litoris]|uniref:hypothetical protein n=1 Tax=Rhodocaloribacter litoris TaxID=2558931 RepID=UPI00141F0E5E|nr:hypothetical protein [Rhodocaloribacter litoris]QXD14591.1 hypothetical protein GQ464_014305 [Rhodocaloribacter litoris]
METTGSLRSLHLRYAPHLKPWVGTLFLAPWCLYFVLSYGTYTFMDTVALIFHEAGHVFFAPFGPFLRIAGGTLMQVLLPLFLVWNFRRQAYRFGVQAMLVWLGHNLLNVSVYAADAQVRQLPLLGGDRAVHDWAYLLGELGLLPYAQAVGSLFFALALLVFSLALVLPRFSVD